jgi:hypothetical protein
MRSRCLSQETQKPRWFFKARSLVIETQEHAGDFKEW